MVGLSNSIQNRESHHIWLGVIDLMHSILAAVAQIEKDLSATSAEFSLSIAVFMLVLGIVPLAWTSISEVKGRKVYRSFHVPP